MRTRIAPPPTSSLQTRKIAADAGSRLGTDGMEHWMVRARLAELRKDVGTAEAIFLEQAKASEAVDMYKMMHEWDDAIAIAETHGLPSAGSMRREYTAYLMSTGQEERAAFLKEGEGDMLGAVGLYLQAGYAARACALVMRNPAGFPRDVLERVTLALTAAGMLERAGALFERMGDTARALDAYAKGSAFRQAVELARRAAPERVVALEKAWGDWLVAHKQPEAAIAHYVEATAAVDAIHAALAARQHAKAAALLEDTYGTDAVAAHPLWRKLAVQCSERGALEEAEKYYLRAGDGRAAVQMYMSAAAWDAAFRLARTYMPEEEVMSLASRQAAALEATGQHRVAEKLLLTCGAVDAVIAMYTRVKSWDALVRVVSSHRPAKLRETHLAVAKASAEDGALRQAEAHYVDAGEWEAAVAMYRAASQWDDAIRVARAHGGVSAGNRVAYAHAMSVGGEAGMKMLQRAGLIEAAVDYALETRQWETALELANKHAPAKAVAVHLKRGMSLEDEGNFSAAEVDFVAAEKPREAIDMYLHAKDWASALRVAEHHDPLSIPDVLLAQGQAAVASSDLATAEALFLDAKRADLAVDAYMAEGAYSDALRVAKKHMPHRVAEVNERIKRAMGSTSSGAGGSGAAPPASFSDARRGAVVAGVGASAAGASASAAAMSAKSGDMLSMARALESTGEYALAVDTYMRVGSATDSVTRDKSTLAGAWRTAVALAVANNEERAYDVQEEAAHRFADLSLYEQAGDWFAELRQFDRAAESYMQAGAWAKARDAAKSAPARIRDAVEAAAKAATAASDEAEEAAASGALDASLDAYAAAGQTDKLLSTAAGAGSSVLATYIYPKVEESVAVGNALGALALLTQYGAPAYASSLTPFKRLTCALLAMPTSRPCPDASLHSVRDVLYKVVAALRKPGSDISPAALNEFDRLMLCTHYASSRVRYTSYGLHDISARASVACLRFAGSLIPADRAFYEAGEACRATGDAGCAFVFLSRYVDLTDVIDEEGDLARIDNSDLAGSGVPPPNEYPALTEHWVDDSDVRDDVRSWVLTTSIDKRAVRKLPTRPCPSCSTPIFEGALGCYSCKATFPGCIVSGYPIPAGSQAVCTACGSKAIKQAWNAVVSKTKACPWCAAPATTQM